MSTIKEVLRFGFIVGIDLVIGTTVGHFIDSWFPFSDQSPNNNNTNQILKDVALTIAQCTVTVSLALALRKEALGEDYLAADTTDGNVMAQALFYGQTNFWRRIDNIYQTMIANKINSNTTE